MNLQHTVPFDAEGLIETIEQDATINTEEGWVQDLPQQAIDDQLTAFQAQIEDYVTSQNPEATVGQVLGLQTITVLPAQPLAAGLPFNYVATQQTFSETPDHLRHRFTYQLSSTDYTVPGFYIIDLNEPTVKLAGKKLALSFRPASESDAALIESLIPEPDPVTGEIDPDLLPDALPGYLIDLDFTRPSYEYDKVKGAVTEYEFTEGSLEDEKNDAFSIQYTYRVGEDTYTGTYVSPVGLCFPLTFGYSEEIVKSIMRRNKNSNEIEVLVSRRRPTISFLQVKRERRVVLAWLFLVGLIVGMAAMRLS